MNALGQQEYEDARQQAIGAAALLAGEGYPAQWVSETVIRAGVMSNDRLSLRKIDELSRMDPLDIRKALRTTDKTYVYFTKDGETIGIFGLCGVGDTTVNATPRNGSINAIAIAAQGAAFSSRLNITMAADDSVYSNLSQQDLVIIDGAISTNISDDEIARNAHDAARNGMMFVILGDPGVSLLGVVVNATTPGTIDIVNDGFSLQSGEQLAVAGAISTIDIPSGAAVANFEIIAETPDGKPAYATWTYGDAKVWYFATAQGQYANGTAVIDTLGNATSELLRVQRPLCANITLPDAEQVATHTRTIAHHDELLDMHVLVWRE
jgi:hypothetical protein